jgi:putative ABC transport system permease protein
MMKQLTGFGAKLRAFFRGERFQSDLQEEMAFHREQLQRELQQDGVEAEEAHYAAQRRFGNELRLREETHDVAGFSIASVWQDVRYALRQMRKNPGFALTAIVILALGIGATTAIFSVVNPILFQPLPYPHPRQVTFLWETRDDGLPLAVSFGSFRGVRERSRSLEAIAVEKLWQPIMKGNEPERIDGQRVSADYFKVLGVAPAIGRSFEPAEDQFSGANVVLLSDSFWHRRFNADPAVIGRAITLETSRANDADVYTIIGVMPRGFENVLAPTAEVWAPLQYDATLPPDGKEWGHHLRMIARLRSGFSREQARSELNSILPAWAKTHAEGYKSSGGAPRGFLVNPLQDDLTRDVKPALLAIVGAVMVVLLVACVNVTNLLLARGAARRGEFAVRAALGASRARVARQVVTEMLLLALLGAVLGMGVAAVGVRTLLALSPAGLPRVSQVQVDVMAFAFALLVAASAGLGFGMVPALHFSRGELRTSIQETSTRTAGGHQFTRHILVVVEVALALVLLVSAGLLLRSVRRLFAVPPGFEPDHLLTMQVQEGGRRFDKDADRARFFEQALDAVRHVPGVSEAAFTSQLPLSGDLENYGMEFQAYPNQDFGPAFRYAVSPGYFAAMRIPLIRGRLLNERDRAGAPSAVVISESLAKRKFGDRDPIGQRVRSGPDIGKADRPWSVIVGVVGDVKQDSLAVSDPEAFYVSTTQWSWVDNVQSLVVRSSGDPASLAPSIRNTIWSVDKDPAIVRVTTMERLIASSESQRSFVLLLFEAFAAVALLLAATGIYGVLSGSVTERTREIGVRSALGASPGNILALVFRQGISLVAIGISIGFVGALVASRALMSLLFGVHAADPLTYSVVVALLLCVAGLACAIPARRAAGIDPAITLRAE